MLHVLPPHDIWLVRWVIPLLRNLDCYGP